jgi:hypothetical protein
VVRSVVTVRHITVIHAEEDRGMEHQSFRDGDLAPGLRGRCRTAESRNSGLGDELDNTSVDNRP